MNRMMHWRVTMRGREFRVETRDRYEWADDHSDQKIRTGAFADIPWSEPERFAFDAPEAVVSMNSHNEAREVTHRRAIESLAHANDCTEERDGEVVAVFTAEVIPQ